MTDPIHVPFQRAHLGKMAEEPDDFEGKWPDPRERAAPARREEMAAFAAELKADPAKALKFFQGAGILNARGELTPQYGGPVAWVRNLTDPQPHCVTGLQYRTAADADAGVQYTPVYTHPTTAAEVQQERYRNSDIERRAPARREEMAAFAAELKADPAKAQAFFQSAGIIDERGELAPQYGAPVQAEPVAHVTVEHFRNNPAMRNVNCDLVADLPPGTHALFLHPPATEVQRLREALKPFAAIDLTTNQAVDAMDVLRARRALEGGE